MPYTWISSSMETPGSCISPSPVGGSSGEGSGRRVGTPEGLTVGKRWRYAQTEMILHKRDDVEVDRLIKKQSRRRQRIPVQTILKKSQWKSQSWQWSTNLHVPVCCFCSPRTSSAPALLTCWAPEPPHGAISCPVSSGAESPSVGAAVLISLPWLWTEAGLEARLCLRQLKPELALALRHFILRKCNILFLLAALCPQLGSKLPWLQHLCVQSWHSIPGQAPGL